MIKIEYGNRFVKDIKKLRLTEQYFEIREFSFEFLPKISKLNDIPDLKKIIGYKNFYRLGNYRIGFRYEKNVIYLDRVLHRKEIYKYFPLKYNHFCYSKN